MKNEAMIEISKKYPNVDLKDLDMIPTPVDVICRKMGINVEERSFYGDVSGVIYKKSNNRYCIDINKAHHPFRKRFTIAHELGHFIKHKNILDTEREILERRLVEVYNRDEYKRELEANEFAGRLLMPKTLFLKRYGEHIKSEDKDDIYKFAVEFEVSTQALAKRAYSLELFNDK